MLQINSIKVEIEYVDSETGEVLTEKRVLGKETKKAKRSSSKKPVDDDPTPKITLIEGKYQFNNAAIELTGFEPDMKINISFEKKNRTIVPVLHKDDNNGNRLTKSYTVSCKGAKRENISAYGEVFVLKPTDRVGYFELEGNIPQKEDDIIDVPEEIEENVDELLDTNELFEGLSI